MSFKKFHFSLKAGPNGPALLTSLSDLVSLPETLYQQIGVLGGDRLREIMDAIMLDVPFLETSGQEYFTPKPGIVRKLVGIPDLEGKTRTIAILDY